MVHNPSVRHLHELPRLDQHFQGHSQQFQKISTPVIPRRSLHPRFQRSFTKHLHFGHLGRRSPGVGLRGHHRMRSIALHKWGHQRQHVIICPLEIRLRYRLPGLHGDHVHEHRRRYHDRLLLRAQRGGLSQERRQRDLLLHLQHG